MTCRNVASGRVSSNFTVWGSTTVMPSSPSALPAEASSNPLMEAKKPAPGLCVAGLTARSIEYFTSSAVISRPLWNLTPVLSLKVKTVPSGEMSKLSARSGMRFVVPGS